QGAGKGVLACYALIRNEIKKSAVYFLYAALSNSGGATICRGHPILWIVVRYATDHRFFGISKFFDPSNVSKFFQYQKML
ncbi:MAG: hypothetical protein ACW97P_11025, partial [Candidatus Hodarchaeales archaeon]